jgi:hypothetical protein
LPQLCNHLVERIALVLADDDLIVREGVPVPDVVGAAAGYGGSTGRGRGFAEWDQR